MKLRGKHKLAPTIPLASMADLAMLLLIFFVVCGRLSARSGVTVEPPRSHTADPISGQRPVTITVSAEGQLYLDGRDIELPALRDELEGLMSHRLDRASRTVHLEVDKRTPYRACVSAIDAINSARAYVELKVIR